MTEPKGTFGPIQLARHLGWFEFQVQRGVRLGRVPRPDRDFRWSAELIASFDDRADQLRAEVGELPDVGASKVARYLADRFGCEVTVDAVIELVRRGVLPIADSYKGYPLYDGRAVEQFADLADRALLEEAVLAGRTVTAADAAAHLRVRRSDLEHLVRAGVVVPTRWVRSGWQARRRGPQVPLYRVADLDAMESDVAIDWAAVRETRPGRVSPLASLPTATNDDDEEVQA
jgi:hypothetical protein